MALGKSNYLQVVTYDNVLYKCLQAWFQCAVTLGNKRHTSCCATCSSRSSDREVLNLGSEAGNGTLLYECNLSLR